MHSVTKHTKKWTTALIHQRNTFGKIRKKNKNTNCKNYTYNPYILLELCFVFMFHAMSKAYSFDNKSN